MTNFGMRFQIFVFWCVCGAMTILSINARSAEPLPEKTAVFSQWKQRENGLRSIRFEWEKEVAMDPIVLKRIRKAPLPAGKLTFRASETLTIFGEWMKFEREGTEISGKTGNLMKQHYISTYNGSESKTLYDQDDSIRKAGFNLKRNNNQDSSNYHLRPMKLLVRPLSPKFTFFHDPNEWKFEDSTRIIEGKNCVPLTKSNSPYKELYWCDRKSECVVAMYQLLTDGEVTIEQQIWYERNKSVNCEIPKKWTTVLRRMGQTLETHVSTVKRYELNKTYKREEFELRFPEGTEVRDDREGTFYLLGPKGIRKPINPRPSPAKKDDLAGSTDEERLNDVTRFTVYDLNPAPHFWCDGCDPYSLGASPCSASAENGVSLIPS